MTNDRNYLRMMHDVELTRHARDNLTTDLELVLLERLWTLIDVEEELEDAKKLIDELSASRDSWIEETVALQAEANMLQASLDRIDAE